ncbi:FxSxx-COOH system tetratricopeptide repeat protein [Kibdelosporangium banguiense]|uniref:FxSxx-COOH system tetratricopeptide repeat protein n=1 Tax=Kibdelosporangium banguiense TaxID=1365924 RepID=UPI00247AF35F
MPAWFEIADAIWLTKFTGSREQPAPQQPTPPDVGLPRDSPAPQPPRKDKPPQVETKPADDGSTAPPGRPLRRPQPEPAATTTVPQPSGNGFTNAPPVTAAQVPPLPDAARIVRALRPLHRTVLSHHSDTYELDEEATAERAVQDGLWWPVVRPPAERWLDLTLVVDSGPSMALWRSTVVAFESLLRRLGTFRTIQRRLLDTNRPGEQAPVLRGGTPEASERGPAELLDPSGRRIVLVLTDGVSRNWRSPAVYGMLAKVAGAMPTALVHLLPQRLWRQTGLNVHRARLKPRGRLAPNSRWSVALPDAWLEPVAVAPERDGAVAVPVLEMESRWFDRFTRLVLGGNDPVDATVVLAHESAAYHSDEDEITSDNPSSADRVKGFLSTASPTAFRLATLLAAVPVSLKTVSQVRAEVVPEIKNEHIAEVLSSPLFEAEPHTHVDSPWDTITFNVRPGVRKELLSSARRSETVHVIRVADSMGHTRAALDSPDSTPEPTIDTVSASDITIQRIVMEALSGPYLSRAERLAAAEENTYPIGDTTTSPSDTVSNHMSSAADPRLAHLSHPDRPAEPHHRLPPPDPDSPSTPRLVTPWMPVEGVQRQPGDVPPIWGKVPPRNLNFTGRAALLRELGDRLAVGMTAVLPKALHGMGGIGKTQTAVEYVYQHLDDYDLIWWIEAAKGTQITASLTELAQALGLPGGAEANTAVPAVREALRRGKPYGRWLLVFDAAEGPEVVRPFFPTNGSGDILITSRNPEWASVARPLEVATFERPESVELLRRRGPEIDDEDADRLANTLGDLPLAIEQAAAWRAETGMPVDEYLRLFDEKVAEILDTSAPQGYELSVAAAWNVSFDELKKRSPVAHQLLQICAFYSPEPISRHIFSGVRGISIAPDLDRALRDPMQLARAIRDVNRYGLAKIDHRNNTLQLHRLVQTVLRNRMSPRQQEEMRHGAHLLLANFDPKDPLSPTQWQRYRDVLPHVYAADLISCDDEWGRELVVNLMTFLYRWGDHDEAISLAERALEKWQESPGKQDAQTLQVASRLGYYYWIMGEFAHAAELNRETLEIRRRVDGENNEDTLAAQVAVATDLRTAGDMAGAIQVTADVYQKARALFGEDDPATLRFARIYCVALRHVGQFQEAAQLDYDTHRRLIEVLGNDHPETLSALGGLILDRREAGDYLWARSEQEKLAIRAREVHGDNNADTLRRLGYLAVARRKAGDHDGALELSTEVLERFETRYGQGNFNAMACALGRSIDLRHAGDLRGAKALGEETLGRYRSSMGDDHPFTRCAEVDLAVTLRLQGDPAAARTLNERALEQLRATLGADHVHAILCSINLASDLAALGESEAAVALNTDAYERGERVLGPDHPTTLAASLNLVLDLRSVGREPDAEKRYADVLARYRRVLGEKHRATTNASMNVRADCDIDPLPL